MSRIIRPEEPLLNISAWVAPRLPKKKGFPVARVFATLYITLMVCTALSPLLQSVSHIMLAGLFGYCTGKVYYFFKGG